MSARKARHKTMQALVRGSRLFGANPDLNHVDNELGDLGRCNSLQPVRRQRFLQIMHATRALDTTLTVVLTSAGLVPRHGIGKMLHQLPSLPRTTQGYLSQSAKTSFVTGICPTRNRYAHKAGAFPTSQREVDIVVSEIHACMAAVL